MFMAFITKPQMIGAEGGSKLLLQGLTGRAQRFERLD
jgi:hypothetical protein